MKEELNKSQKLAVESESPHILVLAGPGTGKTRLIIARILHLLEKGVAPEKILAVTFSRKATFEMEERLLRERPDLSGRLEISTLHAFCVEIIQKYGFRLGLGRKPELISEAQAQVLFRRIADRLPFQYFVKTSVTDGLISDLLTFFQDCKDEGLWPEQVLSYAQSLPEETEEERKLKQEWIALGDIYNAFQSHCFDNGLVDFGDAVLGALRLLEDYPSVSKEISQSFEHILVDEFQDTNWTQIQLLRKICGNSTKICVVGDDDQAIYRFRGASFSAFQFFSELFPEPDVIELNETYRLPPSVANAASALISRNEDRRFRPDKKLLSRNTHDSLVELIQVADFDEEAVWVANKVEELLSSGTPPNEIGILVRAHAHADHLIDIFEQRKIGYETSSTQKFFQQDIIKDCLSFFRLVMYPEDNISFLRLLDSPFLRIPYQEIFKFCQNARFGKIPYFQTLEKLDSIDLAEETKLVLSKLAENIRQLFASSSRNRPSEILLEFCEEMGTIRHLIQSQNQQDLVRIADFLKKLVSWEKLQNEKDLQSLFPVLEAIAQNSLILSDDEIETTDTNRVRILTVHASKGLEFDHVFILSLVGRRFPGAFRPNTWFLPDSIRKEKAPNKAAHVDEERRLLYVAMTRAKRQLYLCTVNKKGTKPSIFVSEDIEKNLLARNCIKRLEIPALPIEKKIARNKTRVFSRSSQNPETLCRFSKSDQLRLSYTQLEKYEKCPLSYWFAFELGIPTPPSASLLMGSCVHKALENFYRKVQQGRIPTSDELLADFETIYEDSNHQYRILTETERQLGKSKLEDYYYSQDGNFEPPLAIEKDFQLNLGPHQIRGKIDRVDQVEGGVRIIDYKTGKSKSDKNPEDQKFAKESLQFSIYALAAEECFGWKVKELWFYYVYDNSVLKTSRDSKQLSETKVQILEMSNRILNNEFETRPGFHCRFCEYKRICPSPAN